MALAVTRLFGPVAIGDRYMTVSKVDFDSSYPTGGEALTPQDLGFAASTDEQFHVLPTTSGGYVVKYDHSGQKLLAYWVDTSVDGAAMAEVVNTTDLSGVTAVRVTAFGRFV
jgi:hypothetical protein